MSVEQNVHLLKCGSWAKKARERAT